eukprot:gb/GECG01008277.1/.p1 GENE.gb/GECG01008277.1/~~gb/GECG01008277.1/.p1  ORF type:complete len:690 (+),score=79.12 gb/GECG01008277.1/:1-2070(+)
MMKLSTIGLRIGGVRRLSGAYTRGLQPFSCLSPRVQSTSASSEASTGSQRHDNQVKGANKRDTIRQKLAKGPAFVDFLSSSGSSEAYTGDSEAARQASDMTMDGGPAYNNEAALNHSLRYYVETYGCQMNVSDTEIVHSILHKAGMQPCSAPDEADVVLLNTCAIRENAEQKIWNRLKQLKALKSPHKSSKKKKQQAPQVNEHESEGQEQRQTVVGVLGCMAERLKKKLLEQDKTVDIIAGPDAYRDLPNLIDVVRRGDSDAGINVQLSQEETYADIAPMRPSSNQVHAFVSIMRGCNNMCTYCVVPFTRGRERSRIVSSVEDEVKQLRDNGYKEVVLLGQNVNSYHDKQTPTHGVGPYASFGYATAPGFHNLYSSRVRDGEGVRFTELLDRLTHIAPEVRFRFTSPHPKDFPDPLLSLMAERPNLCNQMHMPAQSGSTAVLQRMRRLHTREAYIELADKIRDRVPGVSISSDFIAGFCGETEEDHQDTISLMNYVKYEQAFMFAYSMRERTHAAYKLEDDVPHEVKQRRLREIIDTFNENALLQNIKEKNKRHVVLVEGNAKRSDPEAPMFTGRTDNNKRVVFPVKPIHSSYSHYRQWELSGMAGDLDTPYVEIRRGDYIVVDIDEIGVKTLKATPLAVTSIQESSDILHQGGSYLRDTPAYEGMHSSSASGYLAENQQTLSQQQQSI